MALPSKTFPQYVNDAVTAWAASLNISPSLISGDPLLAVMQAAGANATFLQNLVFLVNQLARASTAVGGDLDTWMADFGLTRLPAVAASGAVTLSVLTAKTYNINIPVGSIVQTTGGAISYQLIADTTRPAYNSALNAYVIPAGTTSITATAQALLPGSASNVQIGQISQLGFSGVDTVTNPAAITNGLDPETDAAFRIRFVNYINNLSKATKGAILAAVANVQQGLSIAVLENTTPGGASQVGYFTTVIDDGSGSPPSSLLNTVQVALDSIRGFTIQQSVIGPTKVNVTVACNIRVLAGVPAAGVQTAVQTAIVNYINANGIGQNLYLTKLIQVAIDAQPPNIVSVQPGSMLVNGAQLDLTATPQTVYRTVASSVAIGTY